MQKNQISLGCGLIRIGRIWGSPEKPVPTNKDAQLFLERAYNLGIRFFDTAPAYGLSETRLGSFLHNLTTDQRKSITVATKFGEHWNQDSSQPYVDHSLAALQRSMEQSISRLGSIDVIQLHKASKILLQSDEINQAFDYANEMGVSEFGASVSDIETGLLAINDERLTYLQLPYNQQRTDLLPVIDGARTNEKRLLFNRPFAMGALFSEENTSKQQKMVEAYSFIKNTQASGVVLTGTASQIHLEENIKAFNKSIE